MKKKMKRLADDKRRGYKNVLALSGAKGSQILNNKSEMDKLVGHATGEASEKEARAVAAAIGLPKTLSGLPGLRKPPGPDDEGAPLSRTMSMKSDVTTSAGESPSPTGALAQSPPFPGEEQSPEYEPLDSPVMSDEEEEKEEKDAKAESEGEEARGRTMSQDEGARRTGAKRFVFPNQKRSHSGG